MGWCALANTDYPCRDYNRGLWAFCEDVREFLGQKIENALAIVKRPRHYLLTSFLM